MEINETILNDKTKAFKIFHIAFSIIIFVSSLETVIRAFGIANWPLFTLAVTEVIAVSLFIVPEFTKSAGIALMLIFLIAIVLCVVTGIIMSQLHLIVYLICTFYIVVHGNAFSDNR